MSAEIYSTPSCGQCVTAKQLLTSRDIPYTEYTIGKDASKDEVEARVGSSIRSVPQIFMNDEYVGGLNELKAKIA